MKSTTCDKCGHTTKDTPDDLIDWLVVGFHQTTTYDVCSFHCAHALLKDMAKIETQAVPA